MSDIFSNVDQEKEKIYREVEKHYITEDIARQIFEKIISKYIPDGYNPEDIPSEIWDLCKLDEIYEDWIYNNDANLSHWDNINNAIDVILSGKNHNAIIRAVRAYLDKQK